MILAVDIEDGTWSRRQVGSIDGHALSRQNTDECQERNINQNNKAEGEQFHDDEGLKTNGFIQSKVGCPFRLMFTQKGDCSTL